MKKLILLIVLIVGIVGVFIWTNSGKYKVVDKDFCEDTKEVYYEANGQKIYTICLDSITVNISNKEYELKDYLSNNGMSINDALNVLIKVNLVKKDKYVVYQDGGSKLYTGSKLNVLKCSSITVVGSNAGNNNLYIAEKENLTSGDICVE